MGTKERSLVLPLQSEPLSPSKPCLPPEPRPTGSLWRRATDVSKRETMAQNEQKIRHKSLPSFGDSQSSDGGGTEAGNPSDEAVPECLPSCARVRHGTKPSGNGEGPFRQEIPLQSRSGPDLSVRTIGGQHEVHRDYWRILPHGSRELKRSLEPPEAEITPITGETNGYAAYDGVYGAVDTSQVCSNGHCASLALNQRKSGPLAFPCRRHHEHLVSLTTNLRNIPPAPEKPLPPLKLYGSAKVKLQAEAKGFGVTYENALQDIVTELKEKLPSYNQGKRETQFQNEKRETEHKVNLVSKWLSTRNEMQSPKQKRNTSLAEHVHISLWTKTEAEEEGKQVLEDIHSMQSPLMGERSRVPGKGQHRWLKQFWQNRSLVLKSGVLEHLSKQQLLLQESMYEVVTTEFSYLESLTVAVDHFMESPALTQVLTSHEHKSLFSSIARIREISQNFLDAMIMELDASLFFDVCVVIHRYTSQHFGAYVDYLRNMPYQEQTLHDLRKQNPQFVEILDQLQEHPLCNRLSLKSFLVLPLQRVTRLKILVENILKRTEQGSRNQTSAQIALKEISKVVESCNREVGKMKQMEELVRIANKTEFECKALPLISSSRWLVRQGELTELTDKENIFGQRKLSPVYLLLFNDLLLVAVKKGVERFVVQDHVHRSLIEISDAEDVECELDKTFQLVLLKNHKGSTSKRLLRAPSPEEKTLWVQALSPQKRGEDVIYEEWDCPQVQCTESYYTQQPGELSLQLGDVINIIQKTHDGFLEGKRLVDGQQGWFPMSCVREIANEHVQRRHFRQRYHVLQTASHLLSRRYLSQDSRNATCF